MANQLTNCPIQKRLQELKRKQFMDDEFTAAEQYEYDMLSALHDKSGKPKFDDLQDFSNIIIAISNISLTFASAIEHHYYNYNNQDNEKN